MLPGRGKLPGHNVEAPAQGLKGKAQPKGDLGVSLTRALFQRAYSKPSLTSVTQPSFISAALRQRGADR